MMREVSSRSVTGVTRTVAHTAHVRRATMMRPSPRRLACCMASGYDYRSHAR